MTVCITPAGRAVLAGAVPVHAAAVRRHLLNRLTPDQHQAILRLPPDD